MADRRLQVFHAVAKQMSFTKAAETLFMTQPAVTFQPGQAFQQPPRQAHEGQNASATAPVKVLAFYLADKGQPLTTAVPK